MLNRIAQIIVFTTTATAFTIAYFFWLRTLPLSIAVIVHNALASLVGIGFIFAGIGVQKTRTRWDREALLLLAIGIAMLAIHLVKLFLSHC